MQSLFKNMSSADGYLEDKLYNGYGCDMKGKSEPQPAPACYFNFRSALINGEQTKKGDRETKKNTKGLYLDSGSVNNRCPIIRRGKTTSSLIVTRHTLLKKNTIKNLSKPLIPYTSQ